MDEINDIYIENVNELIQKYEEKKNKKRKRFQIIDRADYYKPNSGYKKTDGDAVLNELLENLSFFDKIGLKRSVPQKEFHRAMLQANIRNIYKDDFNKKYLQILEKYPFLGTELRQEILICCPRRFGKTFATAMFVTACLLSIPEIKIAIFSPGRRQSSMLLDLIRDFVIKFPRGSSRIETKNQEKMVIRGNSPTEKRTVWAYPSSVKTLKGVGGDIIILEEMAVIDTRVFFEVVVPLLELSNTAMIGISTIKDEDNFMSHFLEMKDDTGKPFFKSFMFYMACEACRLTDNPAGCTHLKNLIPPWQSSSKHEKIKALMSDQQELLNQEVFGISNSKTENVFTEKSVMKFIKSVSKNPAYIPYVYISIDPNGGGDSNFALISSIIDRGRVSIIGCESVKSKTVEMNFSSLKMHYDKLNENPIFKNSLKVFIIENNLGFEAQHYNNYIKNNLGKCVVLQQHDRVGFHTDHRLKEAAARKLREYLLTDMITLSESFFSACSNVQNVKKELLNQLKNYKLVKSVPENTAFGKIKQTFTGKLNNRNDDICIALQLNLVWANYFLTNDKYRKYRDY